LKLIAQGLKTREIAVRPGIHVKTVETHRAELMNRLGIRNVAGLVRHAIRIGLVPVEPTEPTEPTEPAEASTLASAAVGGD
jgi:two-component system, NarL family, response regulator LiaR